MKKYVILLAVMMIVGCGAPKEEITKQRIIDSLASAGFVGEEKPKFYTMIGAEDGFGIESDDFDLEVYKFPNAKLAKECPVCKEWGEDYKTSGQWGVGVSVGEAAEILTIFQGL